MTTCLSKLADLFQGYDSEMMDMEESQKHIILTTLARGDWKQIELIFDYYGPDTIKAVFEEDFYGLRSLPVKTSVLWGYYFFPEEDVEDYKRWVENPADFWAARRNPKGKSRGRFV